MTSSRKAVEPTFKYLGSTVYFSDAIVRDAAPMRAMIDSAMARASKALMWSMLGSRDPWPKAGFDFRENAPHNRYPVEREVCECCGRSLDPDDD
jgi:hypothetical protein